MSKETARASNRFCLVLLLNSAHSYLPVCNDRIVAYAIVASKSTNTSLMKAMGLSPSLCRCCSPAVTVGGLGGTGEADGAAGDASASALLIALLVHDEAATDNTPRAEKVEAVVELIDDGNAGGVSISLDEVASHLVLTTVSMDMLTDRGLVVAASGGAALA